MIIPMANPRGYVASMLVGPTDTHKYVGRGIPESADPRHPEIDPNRNWPSDFWEEGSSSGGTFGTKPLEPPELQILWQFFTEKKNHFWW